MAVLKYAIAAAIGYWVGQPSGQRQLQRLRGQVTELARGPQATQLKERGRTIAAERVSAARDLVHRTRTDDATAAPHTDGTAHARTTPAEPNSGSGTEFDDRTAAEDSETAWKGVIPPSPVGQATQEIHPTEQQH